MKFVLIALVYFSSAGSDSGTQANWLQQEFASLELCQAAADMLTPGFEVGTSKRNRSHGHNKSTVKAVCVRVGE